eukprot:INCI13470.4.p1 GENE.INCI13470.4~~INCI13470.4.p1  ORF type:complete len:562 (-),score=65.59 INCI13470.4:2637-4322(-)
MLRCSSAAVVAAAILLLASNATAETPVGAVHRKPNIVLIVADDMGYNELNYMNTTRGLATPHIDALADSGVSFHNYYVQPICSPTRSAMMTGLYPMHIGTQSSVIFWDTPWGVPLDDHMIPQLLKEHAGYTTAMFGKWHLGMFKEDYCPWKRGFDEYRGYLQGCGSAYTHVSSCCSAGSDHSDESYVCPGPQGGSEDYRAWDWFNATSAGSYVADFGANHSNSAHLIRDTANDFLHRQADARSPFFLYLPFQNIHGPYTCDDEFYQPYANRTDLNEDEKTIFGYITELDAMIGSIMQTLQQYPQLDNNTWIFFTSDNGAPPHSDVIGRNFPLRGHKASLWEGGVRVPGFVSSPLLPAHRHGTRSNELYHVTDLLPTFLELAGVPASVVPQKLDGHSLVDSLVSGSPSPRSEILVNINPLCASATDSQANAPRAGIRVGDMKLLVPCFTAAGINGSNHTGPELNPPFKVSVPSGGDDGFPFQGPDSWPMLFNLTADISESVNVASQHPDIVANLMARLTAVAKTMVEPQQWDKPYQGNNYFCANCSKATNLGDPDSPSVPWL